MTIPEKLKVLTDIAKRLNENNIKWGVGASLLLYFKSITDTFNDIDLMVTAEDVDRLRTVLSEIGKMRPSNPNKMYRTRHFYEFVIDGVDVDVMEGFTIVRDGVEYDCSFTSDSIDEYINLNGEKIPLQSVSDWRRFYELMGRDAKVEMIDRALDK